MEVRHSFTLLFLVIYFGLSDTVNFIIVCQYEYEKRQGRLICLCVCVAAAFVPSASGWQEWHGATLHQV